MTNTNGWGLGFTKVDVEKNEFESLLALDLGDEMNARSAFHTIASKFEKNHKPDVVIDLLDHNDDLIDDYPVTHEQARIIASWFGHSLEPAKGEDERE